MSKQDALRFMMALEKDAELKGTLGSIMVRYEVKSLQSDEWDRVVREHVIPLAKKSGYDFSLEDLQELRKSAEEKMEDDAHDRANGDRGQFTETSTVQVVLTRIIKKTTFCELAPDDQTFINRYNQFPNNHCPDYAGIKRGPSGIAFCSGCVHCQKKVTIQKQ